MGWPPLIVGLTGYAGSGKDAAGQYLDFEHAFQRLAFADALKSVAYDLGWDGSKNAEGRDFLVRLGKGMRDHVHPQVWILPLEARVEEAHPSLCRWVVADVRYENEAHWIRGKGGIVIHIARPGYEPANKEEERSIGGLIANGLVDLRIENSGDLGYLCEQLGFFVDGVLRQRGWK